MPGLNVYFRHDLANFLKSAAAANLGATNLALEMQGGQFDGIPQEVLTRVYRRGFFAALLAVGLAVGLEPSDGATVQQLERGQAAIPSWVEIPYDG